MIDSLITNFSFSDIIAFISMIVATIAAIVSWVNKRNAQNSEIQAAKYAKNADEANLSAKKYYDEIHEHLQKQKKILEKEELKNEILMYMETVDNVQGEEIADKFNMSVEYASFLLRELEAEGRVDVPPMIRAMGIKMWKKI